MMQRARAITDGQNGARFQSDDHWERLEFLVRGYRPQRGVTYLERMGQTLFGGESKEVDGPSLKLRNGRESSLKDRIEIPL